MTKKFKWRPTRSWVESALLIPISKQLFTFYHLYWN